MTSRNSNSSIIETDESSPKLRQEMRRESSFKKLADRANEHAGPIKLSLVNRRASALMGLSPLRVNNNREIKPRLSGRRGSSVADSNLTLPSIDGSPESSVKRRNAFDHKHNTSLPSLIKEENRTKNSSTNIIKKETYF